MKRVHLFILLGIISISFSCTCKVQTHQSKHVILIGLDGVGAYGFQRAATPRMNEMVQNGALSIKARCILESSSSQNWMTMLTGAIPNQHGVTSNDWQPDNYQIEPILKNKAGFFPSIFDLIKAQKPESKVYMFYEWDGLGRLFDLTVPDKVELIKNGEKVINKAIESFFADKPDFLFVDVDETDHAGHFFGHESHGYFDCITKYDSIIGGLIDRLKVENMLDETVVIVTGDHGGIQKGHGGNTPNEMEIPILLYGGKVTKGRVMEHSNLIADIAPTVAGLLGVTMPVECVGKFIYEAFEPKTAIQYSPMPVIIPASGFLKDSVEVIIRADSPDAKIYYTLDGSEPTNASIHYAKPIILSKSALLKAVSIVGNTHSKIIDGFFRVANASETPAIKYALYKNYNGEKLPDFKTLGKPDQQGEVFEFSLAELNCTNQDHFAVLFTSTLQIDQSAEYWFSMTSDDGSKLYIDNTLVINNDGSHSNQLKKGKILLSEGLHSIRLEYFDDSDGEYLELSYRSNSIPLQVVPFSKLGSAKN
ncbi:MAG: alkaline phosphatase family protein [Prolixibacteraceae bacterium]|nr:alkaline phosphatase family protein [Prolixibacteraceae bacterium]